VNYKKTDGTTVPVGAEVAREYKMMRRILRERGLRDKGEKRWTEFKDETVAEFARGQREDLETLDLGALKPGGKKKSITLHGENGETAVISYRTYMAVNQEKADRAMELIRAEVEAVSAKQGKMPEVLRFFITAFDAKRGWSVGPEYITFVKVEFRNKRLKEAQRLLLDAIEPRDSDYYISVKGKK